MSPEKIDQIIYEMKLFIKALENLKKPIVGAYGTWDMDAWLESHEDCKEGLDEQIGEVYKMMEKVKMGQLDYDDWSFYFAQELRELWWMEDVGRKNLIIDALAPLVGSKHVVEFAEERLLELGMIEERELTY